MPLTGKHKRQLKARGQTMPDDVVLGKAGPTEPFVAHAKSLLERKELVKIRFADVQGADRKALAKDVCAAIGAECVQILGRTMLVYRANPALAADKRLLS